MNHFIQEERRLRTQESEFAMRTIGVRPCRPRQIPSQPDPLPALSGASFTQYEAACPKCESTAVQFDSFDFGVDEETGYQDAGEVFKCEDCGHQGGIDDLLRRPVTGIVIPFPAPATPPDYLSEALSIIGGEAEGIVPSREHLLALGEYAANLGNALKDIASLGEAEKKPQGIESLFYRARNKAKKALAGEVS